MSELSPAAKRELLARLIQTRAEHAKPLGRNAGRSLAAVSPPLKPISRVEDLELSFAQEMVWLLEQLLPDSLVYNVVERFRFDGRLDVELLRRSIELVVTRHEVLRTIYPTVDGRPVQRIEPPPTWTLPFVDLRKHPNQERDAEARRRIMDEAKTRFELTTGPLMRTLLLQLGDEEYVLAITVHHIAIDGWSLRLLMHELVAIYSAFVEKRPPILPKLPVQYADFAHWQRQWLRDEALAGHRDYWREQLGKYPPRLKLPTDYMRPSVRTFDGACHYAVVQRALLAGLRDLSRREGVTLFITLITAFSTLMMRYTGQEDFVMGSVIGGRIRPEIEYLLGFFANIVALRADLSGNPTFQEAISRTRDVVFGAHDHQLFPFQQLVAEFNPDRVNINPFTQISLNMLNYRRTEEIILPGLRVNAIGGLDLHPVVDGIVLLVSEGQEQLDLCYLYSTQLFEPATIERLADHFLTLLAAIVADLGTRLWDLPLLSKVERTLIEEMSAATGPSFPTNSPLNRLFEIQAEARPDAIAVTSEGKHVTYAELNDLANSVARRLRSLGVGPDVIVGLFAERSLELVIGILGILKAGGAYLPLDPHGTQEDLSAILSGADSTIIVTHRTAHAKLTKYPSIQILLLEDALTDRDTPGLENCIGNAEPHKAACVIYTSGFTGEPKGVLVTHANVGRLLASTSALFHFGPDDVWSLLHSSSSYFFQWELWGALTNGGRLVVVPSATQRDPNVFLNLLARERVTIVSQSVRAFRRLAEACRHCDLSDSIRLMVCGGGDIDRQSLRAWFDRHEGMHPRLVHMYGMAETCGPITYHFPTVHDIESRAGALIGIPLPDVHVRLLDAHGHLVPLGVPGELYVGGPSLAQGYFKRPDLTAQHYLFDSGRSGERLYRSGDLARRLPNGQLELLGRINRQVEIQGFRLRLEEIESALAEHPAIREAVVIFCPDGKDGPLMAYVTLAASSSAPAVDELMAYVRRKLPPQVLPRFIEILADLPLNSDGEVDRQSLSKRALGNLRIRMTAEQPVTMSRDLQQPSSPHTGEESVEDLMRRLQSLGLRFSLENGRLKANTPKGVIDDDLKSTITARRAEIIEALSKRISPLPLSAVQRRFWFMDRFEQGESGQAVGAVIRLDGLADLQAFGKVLERVVERHEILRMRIGDRDDQPWPEIIESPKGIVKIADLTTMPEAERETEGLRLCEAQITTKFDLVAGPLCRLLIVRLTPDVHLLTISTHHIIADGWSLSIIVQEIAAHYSALLRQQELLLAPPPLHYVDYAAWEGEQINGDVFGAQLSYWKSRLSNAPALLALPTDRARPSEQSFRGGRVDRVIEKELLEGLMQFSQRREATLFMTILAAWAVVLHRVSSQDDIVIGTPNANRDRPEFEQAIGPFVNSLALRFNLADNPTFTDFLTQVRRTTIDAIDNREIPFDHVVDAINPARTLNHSPIFQVMFALHNFPAEEPNFAGLKSSFVKIESEVARLDLALDMIVHQGTLVAAYEYAADLFDPATIEKMHDYLRRLLCEILIDDRKPIRDLTMRSSLEDKILLKWNSTDMDYDRAACAHQLFERAVALTPDAPAVTAGTETFSYREVDQRADRLAHFLQRGGVGKGGLVAICLDRTIDLPVAMLAVLKTGAAYVPLDPTHPSDRLRYTLKDAGVACVVTVSQFGKALDRVGISQIHLDEIASELQALQTAFPKVEVRSDDLAYVIYTSGSTGRPKGVQVEHRNLVNFLNAMHREPGFDSTDVLLAITTPSFDIAGLEIWLPLSLGGRVVIASGADVLDGGRLIQLLEQQRITLMQATPTTWRLLLAAGWAGKSDLKALCGGEAMPRDLAAALIGRVAQLWNMYGPTETTIWSTAGVVYDPSRPPSIGRPIANTRVYVVEPSGMLAPIGAFGELLIGGEGVARGYLNLPDLTAEKFVTISLPGGSTERVYRTGDVVRFRSDGQLEFQGRRDHQIKLRGYRIELEEVEAVLGNHPSVKECVVIIREDEPGDQRLVGYIVARPGLSFDPDAARSTLRAKLPAYMVPNELVTLSSLPLTPNGKINRKALPIPEQTVGSSESTEVVMNPVQRRVAELWREILKIKRVSLHDNFFDVGGHSMMVVRLHGALNREFGSRLTLTELFQQTTVAMQANRISLATSSDIAGVSSDGAVGRAQARARSQLHG